MAVILSSLVVTYYLCKPPNILTADVLGFFFYPKLASSQQRNSLLTLYFTLNPCLICKYDHKAVSLSLIRTFQISSQLHNDKGYILPQQDMQNSDENDWPFLNWLQMAFCCVGAPSAFGVCHTSVLGLDLFGGVSIGMICDVSSGRSTVFSCHGSGIVLEVSYPGLWTLKTHKTFCWRVWLAWVTLKCF